MNESERWLIDNLTGIRNDLSEVKADVAVLKERTAPKPKKSRKWVFNLTGIGAAVTAIWAIFKGGA